MTARYITLQVILSLVFSVGCGSATPSVIQPEFLPIVQTFLNEAHLRGMHPSMQGVSVVMAPDGNFNGDRVGQCWYGSGVVEIRESYWRKADYNAKENLIFHELGHCVLQKGHKACPDVMCSSLLPSRVWGEMRGFLLNNFFKP